MIARLTLLFIVAAAAASGAEETIAVFRKIVQGHVAFCRPSEVDELQVIGVPRWLSPDEARAIAAILSADATWHERQADGTIRGSVSFCIPHYDFKFILAGKEEPTIAIRLCTSCRQVAVTVDGVYLKLPNMRKPGLEALGKLLDSWFPNWAEITTKNRSAWERRQRPNKAPEPTPPSVTPPAFAGVAPAGVVAHL